MIDLLECRGLAVCMWTSGLKERVIELPQLWNTKKQGLDLWEQIAAMNLEPRDLRT